MPSPDLFAELGALSNFTFLEGASHPSEIVATAKALGMPAIGIADRNSAHPAPSPACGGGLGRGPDRPRRISTDALP